MAKPDIHEIEDSIEISRPVMMVYNQWTQFEKFPEFMTGIEMAHQVDDTHVHWKAKFGRRHEEWDAEITEQEPDRRISWKSVSGAHNAGTMRFMPLGKDRTRVHLVMAYETRGTYEELGHALGRVRKRVKDSLCEFKDFAEGQAFETGGWRGEVVNGEAHRQPVVHSPVGWPLMR